MKMMIAVISLLAAASMADAQVNFDQGVELKAFTAQAAAAKVELPESKFGVPTYSSRDCKKVEFTADSPLTSADISLRSMEMYQDCQNYGYPVGQVCTSRPEYFNETTRVTVTEPRELKPGQKEVFEVCLWGQFLNLRPVSTVYKYKVKTTFDGIFITPQGLIAAQEKAAGGTCKLAMETGYSCVYKCADGNYISRPNPFPVFPSPNPWVGPIHTPCQPFAQQTPFEL